METVEALKQRIASAEDLQSVVRTMKALAAVSIRQYEKAVEALADYNRTIEMGLQIVLRSSPEEPVFARHAPRKRGAVVIIGSDLGMCGQINEQVSSHAVRALREMKTEREALNVLVVGRRVSSYLEDSDFQPDEVFDVPGNVKAITPLVQDLLIRLESLLEERQLDQVTVLYTRHESQTSFKPDTLRLLPIDSEWLAALRKRTWQSRMIPMFTMPRNRLFSAMIRQYFFVGFYRATAESLASENAARLIAMQGAERNIEERIDELTARYHQQRQMSITSELLDIVGGFEALRDKESR